MGNDPKWNMIPSGTLSQQTDIFKLGRNNNRSMEGWFDLEKGHVQMHCLGEIRICNWSGIKHSLTEGDVAVYHPALFSLLPNEGKMAEDHLAPFSLQPLWER